MNGLQFQSRWKTTNHSIHRDANLLNGGVVATAPSLEKGRDDGRLYGRGKGSDDPDNS